MDIDLTRARRCDNPECRRTVAWVASRGRPARYCSDRCRQRRRDLEEQLTRQLTALREEATGDVGYREARQLGSRIAHLEWTLSAFVTG